MTNAERRERRREAALKGQETRKARLAAQAPAAPEPPRLETAEEAARRSRAAEAKRLEDLRALIRLAQDGRRESDLRYHAHLKRWSHHPIEWTAGQIDEARRFIEGFRREDGTWSFTRGRKRPWL
jgi:hypothetical protein